MEKSSSSPDIQQALHVEKESWAALLGGGFVIGSSEAMSGAYFGAPDELMQSAVDSLPASVSNPDLDYLLPLDDPQLRSHDSGIPL